VIGITAGNDRSNPIAHEVSERDLIDLPNDPMGVTGLKQALDFTLSRSVNTWSGRFFDKLYAGSNSVGCLSELVIGFLNTNVHVYHVSPIFTR
jgi:glutamate decarboxylase